MNTRPPWVNFAGAFVAVCGIVAAGYGYYAYECSAIRDSRLADLKAIAETRADAITLWRTERLKEARLYSRTVLRRQFLLWKGGTDSSRTSTELLDRMKALRENESLQNVLLVDPDGTVLLAADPRIVELEPNTRPLLAQVLAARDAVFGEPFRCKTCNEVHLDVAAPILDDLGHPIAVVILRTDPETTLFPLVQSWPTASPTAETLLVRKDGDDALLLNVLRHRKDPALSIRFPVKKAEVPAVQAVTGHTGVFEGRDYRGVPVVAELLPVKGSSWFLVSKVDEEEVFGEVHAKARMVFALGLLAILLVGAAGVLLSRNRRLALQDSLLRAERERREAAEEAHVTLYSIGDGVIATDAAGRVTRMNPVAETLTGWTEASARGRPLAEVFRIVNEETRAPVESPVDRVLKEGVVVGLANHTVLVARDGTERPIADSGAPIRKEGGEVGGVILVFQDQTREREAQRASAETEARFLAFFDGAPIGKAMTLPDGRLDRVNPALCNMLGYPADELVRKTFLDITHPDDVPDSRERVRSLLAGEADHCSLDKRYLAKDGRVVWAHVSTRLHRDSEGHPAFLMTHVENVTETRQQADQLRAHETALLDAFQLAPIGVAMVGMDLRFLYCNRAFCAFLGYDEEELTQKTILEVTLPDDQSIAAPEMRAMVEGDEGSFTARKRYLRKDGAVVWGEVTINLIRTGDGQPRHFLAMIQDIQERKQWEDKLVESEASLRAVLDATPFPVALVDAQDDRIEYWSRSAIELFGHTAPTASGWYQIAYPDPDYRREVVERWKPLLEEARRSGRTVNTGEYRVTCRDGSVRLCELHARFLANRLVVTLNDITERKRIEEELRRASSLVDMIVENIPDMIFLKDGQDLRFVRFNRAGELLLGHSRDVLLGRTDYDLFPKELADSFVEKDREVLQGQRVLDIPEEPVVTSTGTTVVVHTKKVPIYGPDGRPEYLLGISEDITERRRAEGALQQSQEQFRILFEHAADSILLLEMMPEGNPIIRDVNEAALRLLGWARDELIGQSTSFLEADPDSSSGIAEKLRNAPPGTGIAFEVRHPCKDGTIREFEASLREIQVGPKTLGISVERDITGRKAAEATSRQQQKLESIGTLASGVAHEINNPLNVIMNYGQLLLDDPLDPERVKDCAAEIVKESERVAAIVRNLLSFARQDKESHSPARIADIVVRTLSLIQAGLQKDQIAVSSEIPVDLPVVRCRSQQIQQVLLNLLTNARDALNERHPKTSEDKVIRISASVFEKDGCKWVRLTVENHGNVIPPEVRSKLFDPFFTTKARDKGTGLGLSISYGIVKEHRGEIWFESEQETGTRFHVDLRTENGWSLRDPAEA